jgi:16S rRNA G966 N2-methylase RsmD
MPFTRDAARSLQPDAASNYLVHGEALAVMRELPTRFESNFRLLYADPPYNTGYDWKQFNDRKRVEEWEAYLKLNPREASWKRWAAAARAKLGS